MTTANDSAIKKILVIGASGMIGKPVTRELIKAGFDVTILARDPQKMQLLFPGIKVIAGDVLDPTTLHAAFAEQEGVYVSLQAKRGALETGPLPEREGLANIIEAAKEAGIKKLGYLSSLVQQYNGTNGYNWWVFDMKEKAVEAVKSSGIPYSMFYGSIFMETLDQLMRSGNKILLAGESRVPMYFIAGEDFGKQVAWSFRLFPNENKEYIIQGTEAYNFDDAAAIFIDNYSKAKLKIMKAPLKMLGIAGIINRKTAYGYKIITALNNYPEKFQAEQTWNELGKPSITLAEYAQKQSR